MVKDNDYIVVQSKDLNDAFYKESYTLNEKKLILQLISTISEDDEVNELKEIDLKEFSFLKDLVDKNKYSYIHHHVCRSIKTKTIDINGLWYSWFAAIGCKKGKIFYKFDEDVKEHIANYEKNYNKFFLKNILSLNKNHSIRIYEIISLLVKWDNPKQEFYRKMKWEDFRKYLNLSDKYKNNDVNARVLKVVQKEIEEKTDLRFEYHIIKKNRWYDYINFTIFKNKVK